MSLHKCLACLFVILTLGGCAQAITGQAQPPDAPYSHESGADTRGGGVDGGGGGSGM
jgi:hypothetical protein